MNNGNRNIHKRTSTVVWREKNKSRRKNSRAWPKPLKVLPAAGLAGLLAFYVGHWLVELLPLCISRNSLSINFHSPFTYDSDANADIHKQIKVEGMNLKIRFLFSLIPNFIADSPISVGVWKVKVYVYHANKTTSRECRLEVSLWISVLNVNCFVVSARFAYCTDSLFVIISPSLFLETSCSERVHVSDFCLFVYMRVLKMTWKHVLLARKSVGRARKEGNVLLSISRCSHLPLPFRRR